MWFDRADRGLDWWLPAFEEELKVASLDETWFGTIIELSEGHAKVKSEEDVEAVGGGGEGRVGRVVGVGRLGGGGMGWVGVGVGVGVGEGMGMGLGSGSGYGCVCVCVCVRVCM
jgi:hypothetical protein